MDAIYDLMNTYRWPMPAGLVLFFTACCLPDIITHSPKKRK